MIPGENDLFAQAIQAWTPPLAVFGLTLLAGWLLRVLFDRLALPGVARAGVRQAELLARSVHGLVLPASILVGLQLALPLLPLSPGPRDLAARWLSGLLIALVAFVAGRVVSAVAGEAMERVEGLRPLAGVGRRIILLVIWALGLLTALSHVNIEITPLLTTLGVAGLATALALQDTLANFFAGLYLLADRPVRIGDYVKVNSGVEGYVVEVGWRSTRIRHLANHIIVIPNQKVAQSVITNYCLPGKRTSLAIPVGVSYAADPETVERVLLEEATGAIGAVEGLLAEPPPSVRLIPGFGESALQFTLACHVREFVDQFAVQHELRKRILRRLRAEGIEMPFPQRIVHLDVDALGNAARAASDSSVARPEPS